MTEMLTIDSSVTSLTDRMRMRKLTRWPVKVRVLLDFLVPERIDAPLNDLRNQNWNSVHCHNHEGAR